VKRYAWMPLLAALLSCNEVGFDAVLIRPIYSYVDGCAAVKVSGHGFAADTTVSVSMPDAGGSPVVVPLDGIVAAKDDPNVEDERLRALNEGFYVTGVMPPAPNGASGYASIIVKSGGLTDTLEDAYYYVACPADGYLESIDPADAIKNGSDVSLTGCNLDAGTMSVQLVDENGQPVGEPIALVSDCGTAQVHFTAPNLSEGSYYVTLVAGDGNLLAGEPCSSQDSATYYCTDFPITFGGAK
jgi:hypothetical protein